MPRADNANGARAKVRSAAVMPVSAPLVRLYSEYMHAEYGDIDSDYVFVNLFGGRVGAAMTYTAVHKLIGRIAARTGIGFTAHMLRHSHATDMIRQGVPIEVVARLLTHRSSTTTSQTYVHLDAADIRDALRRAGVWQEEGPVNSPMPARRDRPRLQVVSGEAAVLDGQWASDHWDAGRLGISARRGRGTARFGGISQPWLRDPVKRWSRFRLATGCAFATIDAGALALTRFSRFLAARHPQAADASAITRPVLEDYLSWLLTQGYSASTRALSLSMIRVFFDACHRHGWLPGLAASATIYVEELPFHHDEIARFIPEFVMAQLESERGSGEDPAHHHPPPRGGDDRDRAARRGRVHAAVQPGAHRQQRLAVPAVRGRQGPRRAADPAQRQGRGGDQRPAGLRAPALAGGQPVAVPRHRPATTTAPSRTRIAPSSSSSDAGSASSACATRPGSRSP